MTNGNEVWLPVKYFEGYYEVSDLGRVRGFYCGGNKRVHPKVKTAVLNKKNRYLYVILSKNKQYKSFLVHRLVLSTFDKYMPSNIDCRHLDGNRLNCALYNLKWGTRKQNEEDKTKHGTRPVGVKNHLSKLSENDVLFIRQAEGTTEEIALKYGVCQQNLSAIKSNKTWRHI